MTHLSRDFLRLPPLSQDLSLSDLTSDQTLPTARASLRPSEQAVSSAAYSDRLDPKLLAHDPFSAA